MVLRLRAGVRLHMYITKVVLPEFPAADSGAICLLKLLLMSIQCCLFASVERTNLLISFLQVACVS